MSFQSYIAEFTEAAGEIFSEPQNESQLNATPETIKYDQLLVAQP